MEESKRLYRNWVMAMLDAHPEGAEWKVPLYVEPESFRNITRAMYLAMVGPHQAADWLDDLFSWPPKGHCRYVCRFYDMEFAGVPLHDQPQHTIVDLNEEGHG